MTGSAGGGALQYTGTGRFTPGTRAGSGSYTAAPERTMLSSVFWAAA